jgi:hypothetical protein
MKAGGTGIIVVTPNPSDENTYPVQVTASPPFGYDPSTSTTQVSFNIIVKCEPRKIAPGLQETTFSFTIGSYTPLTIEYKQFIVTPACKASVPTYSVAQSNGGSLPSYILADTISGMITVVDDGTLKVSTIELAVTGYLGSLSGILILKVKILPSLTSQDLSKMGYQLPRVSLIVFGNQLAPTMY